MRPSEAWPHARQFYGITSRFGASSHRVLLCPTHADEYSADGSILGIHPRTDREADACLLVTGGLCYQCNADASGRAV